MFRRPRQYVCVLSGSNEGGTHKHTRLARELGDSLGQHGTGLLCSGRGLSNATAAAAVSVGARVIEVVPYELLNEQDLLIKGTEVQAVRSAHEQNKLMYQLANVIIALPGGVEVVGAVAEMIAWAADARTLKPIILLDDDGHFHPLVATLNHLLAQGFATVEEVTLVHHVNSAARALELVNVGLAPAASVA